MTKIENGNPGVVPVSREISQKDGEIVRAVNIAIGEHRCSVWTPERGRILEEGEYGLLFEVKDIFGSFRGLTAEIAIRTLQEKRAPNPLKDDLNIDVFAEMKKDLRAKGVPGASLTLLGKVFREALYVLDTGQTINELERARLNTQKEMALRVIVPESARKSERPGQNPFNKDKKPLKGLAVRVYSRKY